MTKMTIELKVSGIEPMKKIVELLTDNYQSLPRELQDAIGELYAEERTCWDIDHFKHIGIEPGHVRVIVDGVETSKITAIYPDEAEMMIIGEGIRKFTSLQVINSSTGEPICGVGNGDKE